MELMSGEGDRIKGGKEVEPVVSVSHRVLYRDRGQRCLLRNGMSLFPDDVNVKTSFTASSRVGL